MASTIYKEKLKLFSEFLEERKIIDIKTLREYCFETGCPDDNTHYRSLTWKILLGYISSKKSEWEASLEDKRKIYHQFVNELINSNQSHSQNGDHPLNLAPSSQWSRYFRESEILSQIVKDVRRLYPDISFFQRKIQKSHRNCKFYLEIVGGPGAVKADSIDIIKNTFGMTQIRKTSYKHVDQINDESINEDVIKSPSEEEYNWQVVARILFIYAKLNPGQGYVQGMNEIIGPLYYVFANDSKEEWRKHCEADTFWCFTSLMSEIRDMYNSQLDTDQSTGVVGMMTKLTNLLHQEDSQLYYQICQTQVIKPHFYAFRWITLLLSQEFPLPEVLRIWDFLFSDKKRFSFLINICCAMIILLRDDLMSGDFSSNMKLLQNFPDKIDVNTVVQKAKKLKSMTHLNAK